MVTKTRKKVYENFTDKYGNVYEFKSYLEFSKFWFSLSRKSLLIYFPENFKKLNNCAVRSVEAKQLTY